MKTWYFSFAFAANTYPLIDKHLLGGQKMVLDILILVGFGTCVYYVVKFFKKSFGKKKAE